MDPDKSRIAVAAAELEELHDHVPVTFLEGSTKEAIPLGPFDAIFSNFVFHCLERADRPVIVRDMYEMLKPGDRLVFLMEPHQSQKPTLYKDVASLAIPGKDLESAYGVKLDSASIWRQLCTEAGFVVQLFEVNDIEETEPSLDAYLRRVEVSIPTFTSHMLKESDVDELKKKYCSGHDTEIVLGCTVLKVLARRPQVS